jgi:aquaporin Z
MNLAFADIQRFVAELVGTMIVVLFGAMSIVAVTETGAPVMLAVPAGFGLGLFIAFVTLGEVSGGHFNPAVTLGALLDRRISPLAAISYVVAQVLGALAGTLAFLLVGSMAVINATDARTAAAGIGTRPIAPAEGAFVAETLLTAALVLVFLTVTRRDVRTAIFAVPLTYLAIHVVGLPFSAASVNPARSLGPALVSLHGPTLETLWIYLTAPFLGAVIGWAAYRFFGLDREPEIA